MSPAIIALFLSAQVSPQFSVNSNHTLMWNNEPYMPVGLRIEGSSEVIAASAATGAQDVIIELPANGDGWKEALEALNSTGQRFLIAISSAAPSSLSIQVEPDAYRIEDIVAGRHYSIPLKQATEALIIIASVREGRTLQSSRVPVINGVASFEVSRSMGTEAVMLIYPTINDLAMPDLWEGLDTHRDQLLATIQKNQLGTNFRGFVNPIGLFPHSASHRNAVPTSQLFRTEFAAFLRQKYAAIGTVMRAWGVGNSPLTKIEETSRLMPLWANGKGINGFWDPVTERIYPANTNSSQYWNDLREIVTISSVRRTSRLATALRAATGAPIVNEFDGWDGVSARPETEIDGVGVVTGPVESYLLAETAAPGISTGLRRSANTWLIAADTGLLAGEDPEQVIDMLTSMGARGVFIRWNPEIAYQTPKRFLPLALKDISPKTLDFPLEAVDPARAMILPEGVWWLPGPVIGKRLRLGQNFHGYTLTEGQRVATVLWSQKGLAPVKLITDNPELITVTTAGGQPIEVKKVRRGVEFSLPDMPVIVRGIDEPVVPASAFEEASRVANVVLSEVKTLADPDGQEQVAFNEYLSSFDRQPGLATDQMWTLVDRVLMRASPYMWFQATNASESRQCGIVEQMGSQSKRVVRMSSRVGDIGGSCQVTFKVNPRIEGQHDVWIAAKIPPVAREKINLIFGELSIPNTSSPISSYGQGFAWYKLARVNLVRAEHTFTIDYKPVPGAEILLDAMVVSPAAFVPDGPRPPSGWLDSLVKP